MSVRFCTRLSSSRAFPDTRVPIPTPRCPTSRAVHLRALFRTEWQPTRLELAVASGLASPHPPAQGLGLANAGAEAVDGEIEPTASMALGPKNVDSLPLMVMLGNSGLRAELPGRVA